MPEQRFFIFAGGGTGGHLYPGAAIAEQIAALDPDAQFLFICSDKPLDARLLEQESLPHLAIPARPFSLRPMGLMRLLRTWGRCVRASRAAIRDARAAGADVQVVAMGGYVAAPVVQAARVERVPVTLVNLDAAPGKANRWIARRAHAAFTAADVSMEKGAPASWTPVPPIVRRAAVSSAAPAQCRARLGLDPETRTLLITGASQGARSVNTMMRELLRANPGMLRGWQVFHQAGEHAGDASPDALAEAYRAASVRAVVAPYCHDMAAAWGAADLAISRCGAGSVGEVWANAVPTLFLPYPFHRDEHQRKNARPLVDAGAAVIEKDLVDGGANAEAVGPVLAGLLREESRRLRMKGAFRALGPADGAARVARSLVRQG